MVGASPNRKTRPLPAPHAAKRRRRPGRAHLQDGAWQAQARAVSLKTKDREAAAVNLRELLKLEARRAAGISDQYTEAAERPLAEHVEDPRCQLLAKGGTTKQANSVCNNVLRLAELAGWKRLGDIRAGSCIEAPAKLTTTRDKGSNIRASTRDDRPRPETTT